MAVDFIHLHNHTQYSKFDGFSSVDDLVKTAKEMKMPAVGITDHGTIAGLVDFIRTCRKNGIAPIVGMEGYLSKKHICRDEEGIVHKDLQALGKKGNRHLNIIAKNLVGYQNLCALSQTASLDGYYYDPRIDFELLEKYHEGLICTSACLSNIINSSLLRDQYDKAKECVGLFKDIFKDDFYLEMMFHGISAEAKVLPLIQKLGKETDVKILATNDCHYIKKEDAEFQQYLMCMSTGTSIRDPNRMKFPFDEFYFKSPEEMYKLFGHIPSVLTNTLEVAEKCNYDDLIFGGMRLPNFEIPEQFSSPFDALSHLAYEGLKDHKLDKSPQHIERLKLELDDIKTVLDVDKYDFSSYILIVNDIMEYARKKNIAAGIRGSGYASLLLKCLRITEGVDPVTGVKGLLWSRFIGVEEQYFFCDEDFYTKEEIESFSQ